MTKKVTLALLLLLSLLVLAYQGTTLLAAPPRQTTPATPGATEDPLEEPAVEAGETMTETVGLTETVAAEPTLAELAERIDALQTKVNMLAAASAGSGLANEVTTAVYLLDTAGLHGLDVRLNDEGVIEASDAGQVARVARLLRSVAWPAALAADAAALTDVLDQLASALSEDDVETAAALATQAHEEQHDFSHAAEHWLGEISVPRADHAAAGQAFRVTSAVYLLDTAGLHGLDVRLNEEGVIEASDAGQVARVARLLRSVDWPAGLAADAAALTDVLDQLATALSEDNVETAAPLATQAHEEQHDFSHAAEHWLGELTGGHREEPADDHGDEEQAEGSE